MNFSNFYNILKKIDKLLLIILAGIVLIYTIPSGKEFILGLFSVSSDFPGQKDFRRVAEFKHEMTGLFSPYISDKITYGKVCEANLLGGNCIELGKLDNVKNLDVNNGDVIILSGTLDIYVNKNVKEEDIERILLSPTPEKVRYVLNKSKDYQIRTLF